MSDKDREKRRGKRVKEEKKERLICPFQLAVNYYDDLALFLELVHTEIEEKI